jgi:hypothetical protein
MPVLFPRFLYVICFTDSEIRLTYTKTIEFADLLPHTCVLYMLHALRGRHAYIFVRAVVLGKKSSIRVNVNSE